MPGVYYCTGDVVFSGSVSVVNEPSVNQGAAQFFIFPSGSTVPNLVFDSTATVNASGSSADQLQIYMAGDGSVSIDGHGSSRSSSGSSSGSTNNTTGSSNRSSSTVINAMLWAPDATMTVNSPLSWSGSLVLGSFTMEGTPRLSVTHEAPLAPGPLVSWGLRDFYAVPQP